MKGGVMDIAQSLSVLRSLLPADAWNKMVLVVGYAGLITQVVPKLLLWGTPAAVGAADWVARVLLASPLRPLVMLLVPRIGVFLDSLVAALTSLMNTFKDELEKDLTAAAAKAISSAPAAQSSAPPPPGGQPQS